MEWLLAVGGLVIVLLIANWLVAWGRKDDPSAPQGKTHEGWDAEHGGGL